MYKWHIFIITISCRSFTVLKMPCAAPMHPFLLPPPKPGNHSNFFFFILHTDNSGKNEGSNERKQHLHQFKLSPYLYRSWICIFSIAVITVSTIWNSNSFQSTLFQSCKHLFDLLRPKMTLPNKSAIGEKTKACFPGAHIAAILGIRLNSMPLFADDESSFVLWLQATSSHP